MVSEKLMTASRHPPTWPDQGTYPPGLAAAGAQEASQPQARESARALPREQVLTAGLRIPLTMWSAVDSRKAAPQAEQEA